MCKVFMHSFHAYMLQPPRCQHDFAGGVQKKVSIRPGLPTSRVMTETEQRHAQIEKEMLAIVNCCKTFHYYIFGRPVKVEICN